MKPKKYFLSNSKILLSPRLRAVLLLSKRETMTCVKQTSMVEESEKNLQGGNQLCLWQKSKQKYNDKPKLILVSTEKFRFDVKLTRYS